MKFDNFSVNGLTKGTTFKDCLRNLVYEYAENIKQRFDIDGFHRGSRWHNYTKRMYNMVKGVDTSWRSEAVIIVEEKEECCHLYNDDITIKFKIDYNTYTVDAPFRWSYGFPYVEVLKNGASYQPDYDWRVAFSIIQAIVVLMIHEENISDLGWRVTESSNKRRKEELFERVYSWSSYDKSEERFKAGCTIIDDLGCREEFEKWCKKRKEKE